MNYCPMKKSKYDLTVVKKCEDCGKPYMEASSRRTRFCPDCRVDRKKAQILNWHRKRMIQQELDHSKRPVWKKSMKSLCGEKRKNFAMRATMDEWTIIRCFSLGVKSLLNVSGELNAYISAETDKALLETAVKRKENLKAMADACTNLFTKMKAVTGRVDDDVFHLLNKASQNLAGVGKNPPAK